MRRDALVVTMNFYRDAELQGARLLLNLHRHLPDPDSQMKLTRHLADESRHAWLWTKHIADLGGVPAPIKDGYQRRMGRRVGIPKDAVELLALTVVAEKRALDRYRRHAAQPDLEPATREVLEAVTGDEPWHLEWIEEKLHELARERGGEERVARLLERYQAIDREVYAALETFEASLIDQSRRIRQ